MYSSPTLALKYLSYYFHAYNGKGHGVHSPFVFDFITHVLNDQSRYPGFDRLEKQRRLLLQNQQLITVQDFGAGSSVIRTQQRKLRDIAASSLKSVKYARLLHRIARYYQPKRMLELGTSLGITSSYLAMAVPEGQLVTMEGDPTIAAIARQQFHELGLSNIKLVESEFSSALPGVLETMGAIDLAYIDGNHRYAPTMDYFHRIRSKTHHQSILIFDDIHWSSEMEKAWQEIHAHPSVTLSIDLFFIGLVFFDEAFLVKQHFPIRY